MVEITIYVVTINLIPTSYCNFVCHTKQIYISYLWLIWTTCSSIIISILVNKFANLWERQIFSCVCNSFTNSNMYQVPKVTSFLRAISQNVSKLARRLEFKNLPIFQNIWTIDQSIIKIHSLLKIFDRLVKRLRHLKIIKTQVHWTRYVKRNLF